MKDFIQNMITLCYALYCNSTIYDFVHAIDIVHGILYYAIGIMCLILYSNKELLVAIELTMMVRNENCNDYTPKFISQSAYDMIKEKYETFLMPCIMSIFIALVYHSLWPFTLPCTIFYDIFDESDEMEDKK